MRSQRATTIALLLSVLVATGAAGEVFQVPWCQEAMVRVDATGAGTPAEIDTNPVVGDSTKGFELRALFSFDLSFLPPGTTISSAVIHTRIEPIYGDVSSLGTLHAGRVLDIDGSPSEDLQLQWATHALSSPVAEIPEDLAAGNELTADLTSHFQGSYPTSQYNQDPGRAVVRFQFEIATNDDEDDDFAHLNETWLELDVELPDPIVERPLGRHIKRCLPVVASLPGAAGTQWATELHLTGRHDGTTWLYFTETETDGTTNFQVRRIDLDARDTVRFADVLPDLFGVENTKGWLEVFSTDPGVVATARVANVGGSGAYGQTVALIDESKMLRFGTIRLWDRFSRTVNLVMVDADNRTNIGVVNLGPGEATVDFTAIDASGISLGTYEVELDPFEHRQLDRLRELIPEAAGVGLVSVRFYINGDTAEMASWSNTAVYVSRVDNTTGDAVFVVPR